MSKQIHLRTIAGSEMKVQTSLWSGYLWALVGLGELPMALSHQSRYQEDVVIPTKYFKIALHELKTQPVVSAIICKLQSNCPDEETLVEFLEWAISGKGITVRPTKEMA